jgi:hypothetical protein
MRVAPFLVVVPMMFGDSRAGAQTVEQPKRVCVGILLAADPVVAGELNHEDSTRSGIGSRTQRLLPHSFGGVYRRSISVGAEVGYAFRPGSEIVGRVRYTSARSKGPVAFGEFIDLREGYRSTTFASFTSYRAWTFEGGHRWSWTTQSRVSPFVGGLVGIAVVEAIRTDTGFPLAAGSFYKRTVTPKAAASIGIMFRATRGVAIGVESGLGYQHTLNPNLTDLVTGPWINEETFDGRRLSVPLTGIVRLGL